MSPSFVGIVPSIEMVIFAAVGGRASLIGAIYGTLLVNYGKTVFSEHYPELWLFLMGGLFMAVVMFFPDGIAGLYQKYKKKLKFLNKFIESDAEDAKVKGMGQTETKFVPVLAEPANDATTPATVKEIGAKA